jgi:hypothetical protein
MQIKHSIGTEVKPGKVFADTIIGFQFENRCRPEFLDYPLLKQYHINLSVFFELF